MSPDELERAWREESSRTGLAVDADRLLDEVRRRDREFTAKLIRRDVLEGGTALLLVPVWVAMGLAIAVPWTWYLAVPTHLWIAGCMLADLTRHARRRGESGGPLREQTERALAEVRRQVRLLRNVVWWYLLPLGIPIAVFLGHVAWEGRSAGWAMLAIPGVVFVGGAVVFWGVYRMNRDAIRTDLEPRERELEALLARLGEEAGGAG